MTAVVGHISYVYRNIGVKATYGKKEPLTFNARSVSIFFFSAAPKFPPDSPKEGISPNTRERRKRFFFSFYDTMVYVHRDRVHFYHKNNCKAINHDVRCPVFNVVYVYIYVAVN